ncbi:unnamed protein product [Clonostachys chloroleuca]|uniref:Uncharacterized protein n=1 Tax=Clonostachys chloroleuca TaxID=1926264 RepID=A0AA35VDP0_9HYPO|nr:unnamed protein product [Clonostachys chloroleuca]
MKSEVLFTIIFGSIAAALAIIAIVQSHLQHKKRVWLNFWQPPTENVLQRNAAATDIAEGSE